MIRATLATMLCLAACAASAASAATPTIALGVSGVACPASTGALCVVAPGAPMTVTVAGGPGNRSDWIGFVAIATNTLSNNVYLTGTGARPAVGLTGAMIPAAAPAVPGVYNAQFYANDTYATLATAQFTVQADKPKPTPTPPPTPATIPDETYLGNTSGAPAAPSPQALPGDCRPANGKMLSFDGVAKRFVCDPVPGVLITQGNPVAGTPCDPNSNLYAGDPTPNTGWIQFSVCLKNIWTKIVPLKIVPVGQ